MNREQAREAAQVMLAFADGKQIECKLKSSTSWSTPVLHQEQGFDWNVLDYRIKPTPVLRPWTADEVPLGAWIRYKRALHDRSILAWTSNQADRDMWLDEREHSTDGGKTWSACGVVEEAK